MRFGQGILKRRIKMTKKYNKNKCGHPYQLEKSKSKQL